MLRVHRPTWTVLSDSGPPVGSGLPAPWPLGSCSRFTAIKLAVLPVVLTLLGLQATAFSETWTNLQGTRSVEGKMIGQWGDTIVLVLNDGRWVSVEMNDLRAESRIQADEISEQLARQRAMRVQELQAQAAEASAPAPDPLPQPPAAPAYQKPTAGMSAEETIAALREQTQAGHPIVLFDLLPPSYQSDMESLVQQAIGKIDPAAWNAVTRSLHDIGDLIVTHQNWVLSHPRLEALPPEGKEFVGDVILPFAGLLREGLDPDAMQIQSLKEKPLRQWLAARDAAIAPYLVQLSKQMEQQVGGATTEPEVAVESEDDQTATITLSQGESSVPFVLSRVEGFWVPEMTAQRWDEKIKEAKAALAEIPDGTVGSGAFASMVSTMLEPALSPLKQADSEREFHAAMEQLFASVSPAISMAASAMPPGLLPDRRDSPGYGSSGSRSGSSEYGTGSSYGSGADSDYSDPRNRSRSGGSADAP